MVRACIINQTKDTENFNTIRVDNIAENPKMQIVDVWGNERAAFLRNAKQ